MHGEQFFDNRSLLPAVPRRVNPSGRNAFGAADEQEQGRSRERSRATTGLELRAPGPVLPRQQQGKPKQAAAFRPAAGEGAAA